VPGVGKSTTGIELVSSDGTSICQKVTIPKYGIVECHTKANEIAESIISVKHSTGTVACSNTDAALCKYS
jgi:hypothetical protein